MKTIENKAEKFVYIEPKRAHIKLRITKNLNKNRKSYTVNIMTLVFQNMYLKWVSALLKTKKFSFLCFAHTHDCTLNVFKLQRSIFRRFFQTTIISVFQYFWNMLIDSNVKPSRCFSHVVTTTVTTKLIDYVTFFGWEKHLYKLHLEVDLYT